jgi:hypothetical protein
MRSLTEAPEIGAKICVTKGKMYATDVRMSVIAGKTAATDAEGGNAKLREVGRLCAALNFFYLK